MNKSFHSSCRRGLGDMHRAMPLRRLKRCLAPLQVMANQVDHGLGALKATSASDQAGSSPACVRSNAASSRNAVTNTVRFNQLQNIDLPVDFVFDERYGTDTEVLMFL